MLKDSTICVIGAGNMGGALIKGLASQAGKIYVLEKNQASLDQAGLDKLVFSIPPRPPDVLLLATKPQHLLLALKEYQNLLEQRKTLVISIAAGLELKTIAQGLPAEQPLIRAMPNVGALVMRSLTAITANSFVSAQQLELACELFRAVGGCLQVEEKQMDAVTALAGSGPGYGALILEALSDAGVAQGLSRDMAQSMAIAVLQATAELAQKLNLHPAQLKDMVCSPGGTTIHGIMALEQGGLRGLIMRAVQAAAQRSRELG